MAALWPSVVRVTEGPLGCWLAIGAVVLAAWALVYLGGLWVIAR